MPKLNIYLDNAATTPVDPRVLKAMLPYFSEEFGNASSLHEFGSKAMSAVEAAKAQIAGFLGADKEEVYFTSGATESDNLAVLGVIRAIQKARPGQKIHVITSQIEHDAILEPCHELQKSGVAVSYLPVGQDGIIRLAELKKAIRPETALISIMSVNNEIGTIQPIAEIGQFIKELNNKRAASAKATASQGKIYFHTDATQAIGYVDTNVKKLGVDMLSMSAHKIYGPKGVGVLYLKKGTPFLPLFFGGHQQKNIRPGTYNVSGIVGLAKAVELISDKKSNNLEIKKIKNLRDYLIKETTKRISGVLVNGDLKKRTPNNINFIFKGVEGESLVLMLSYQGIAASTGSACSSGSLDPSHVLLAIGVKPELAHGSLRLTLGRFNTKKDVDALLKNLPPIVEKLRKMSPLK